MLYTILSITETAEDFHEILPNNSDGQRGIYRVKRSVDLIVIWIDIYAELMIMWDAKNISWLNRSIMHSVSDCFCVQPMRLH